MKLNNKCIMNFVNETSSGGVVRSDSAASYGSGSGVGISGGGGIGQY